MTGVWVQLYYEGKEEPQGKPTKVKHLDPEGDVADLVERINVYDFVELLFHTPRAMVKVYDKGTTVPIPKGTEDLDPGTVLPANTNSGEPLIVVAPEQRRNWIQKLFSRLFCANKRRERAAKQAVAVAEASASAKDAAVKEGIVEGKSGLTGKARRVVYDGGVFAQISDVWSFPPQAIGPISGSWEEVRRKTTPQCYTDLAIAATSNFETCKDHLVKITKKSKTGSRSTSSSRSDGSGRKTNTVSNIFDHESGTYSRAHQIGKAPECAFFHGKAGAGAVGVSLEEDDEDKELKERLMVYGVEEFTDHEGRNVQAVQGLRDCKKENMVYLNSQHAEYFDDLSKGNLVIIPILDLKACQDWQQGEAYDLLVVASNEDTYDWMAVSHNTKGVTAADAKDIAKATDLANTFAKGLVDLLVNHDLPHSDQVERLQGESQSDQEDAAYDVGLGLGQMMKNSSSLSLSPSASELTPEEKTTLERIKRKTETMNQVRNYILKKKKVALPEWSPERLDAAGKVVLKVSLKDWPFEDYPDPFLVALKGAINLYFFGSQELRHKLLPACPDSFSQSGENDSDSDDDCDTDSDLDSDASVGIAVWLMGSVPTLFERDVNVVTDDDSVSDISSASSEGSPKRLWRVSEL